RIVADPMRTSLGQPILVENVPGASGTIGVGRVARATPDGYTISMGYWGTHVTNGAIYPLQYDGLNDFEPIALLARFSPLLLARKTIPANDLKELIAWLKANPDKSTLGTPGAGSVAHIGGASFQSKTGTHFQLVPYRGLSLAMQDLVGGQIDMMIDSPATSLPQVRAGKIKALAVMGPSRLASAPDIPTVDEAGLPGFYFTPWYALWAPKGTPNDVISRLNAGAIAAMSSPAVQAKFNDVGVDLPPREQQTPDALR